MKPPRGPLLSLLLLLLLLLPPPARARTPYEACHSNPACRTAYRQYPADRVLFDHLYARWGGGPGNTTAGHVGPFDADVAQLLALAQPRRLCAFNEEYAVDAATGVGRCHCPDDTACGHVTPFHNWPMYLACLVSSAALLLHVCASSAELLSAGWYM
jgi:hypothetical protein